MSRQFITCALCNRPVEDSLDIMTHQHEGLAMHAHCHDCTRLERKLFLLDQSMDPKIHLLSHGGEPHVTILPDGSSVRLEMPVGGSMAFLCWRCHSAINNEMIIVAEEEQGRLSEIRFHRECFVAQLEERLGNLERRGLRK